MPAHPAQPRDPINPAGQSPARAHQEWTDAGRSQNDLRGRAADGPGAGAAEGETVCIFRDSEEGSRPLARAVSRAASGAGAEPVSLIIVPRTVGGQELPEPVAGALPALQRGRQPGPLGRGAHPGRHGRSAGRGPLQQPAQLPGRGAGEPGHRRRPGGGRAQRPGRGRPAGEGARGAHHHRRGHRPHPGAVRAQGQGPDRLRQPSPAPSRACRTASPPWPPWRAPPRGGS